MHSGLVGGVPLIWLHHLHVAVTYVLKHTTHSWWSLTLQNSVISQHNVIGNADKVICVFLIHTSTQQTQWIYPNKIPPSSSNIIEKSNSEKNQILFSDSGWLLVSPSTETKWHWHVGSLMTFPTRRVPPNKIDEFAIFSGRYPVLISWSFWIPFHVQGHRYPSKTQLLWNQLKASFDILTTEKEHSSSCRLSGLQGWESGWNSLAYSPKQSFYLYPNIWFYLFSCMHVFFSWSAHSQACLTEYHNVLSLELI